MSCRALPLLAVLIGCSVLIGCGGGNGASASSVIPVTNSGSPGSDFSDLRVYKASAPYAGTMADCVRINAAADSCKLSDLPLIGMETESPAVADIMDRVLVSHDWMGQRFEQALANLPADMLLLLRATTAIVIDADIRPAYYTALTGAIYLDPAYLWLTSEELATINTQADFRAGFSDPLQFRSLSRYLENGEYVYPFNLLDPNPAKTAEDVKLLIAQLLYHELAHANDFLPPATWASLDETSSVYQAIVNNEANFVATRLANSEPLMSAALYSLGDVMYWGDEPTAADLAMTATDVGAAFEADGASDHYAYASQFEDSAMLFEEAMMKLHFSIDREVAFTEPPSDPQYCDYYIIGWGVRNRIGDNYVKERAQFVTNEILLPSAELDLFFQDLPAPQFMTPGNDWCLAAPATQGAQKPALQLLPPGDLQRRH